MDYEKASFEILKMKYQDHVEDLRFRTNFDFRLLSGFVSLNLILAAWLAENPLSTRCYEIAFAVFVFGLCSSAFMLFQRNHRRRKVVVGIIMNINKAFRFAEDDVYFDGRINTPDNQKTTYWFPYYTAVVVIFLVAQMVVIFSKKPI